MKTTCTCAALLGAALCLGLPAAQAGPSAQRQVAVPDGLVTPARVVKRTVVRKTTVTRRTVRHHHSKSTSSGARRTPAP